MAQSQAESTRDIYNYGKYINQFPPNTIKAIWQYIQINKKICRQKMSICSTRLYIYIYIYIYMHTHTLLIEYYLCLSVQWEKSARVCVCVYHIQTDTYGVMVTIVGNGHGDTSSNPGWDCLNFIWC